MSNTLRLITSRRHLVVPIVLLLICQSMIPETGHAEGGDEVVILTAPWIGRYDMKTTNDGRTFAAAEVDDPTTGLEIRVFRSLDGGTVWEPWGTLTDSNPEHQFSEPSLTVTTGSVLDRVFVAYKYIARSGGEVIVDAILVGSADPDADVPSWSNMTIAADVVDRFHWPDITTDAASYAANYHVDLAYEADEADGNDIWFASSLDQGATWQTPYKIASATGGTRHYGYPAVVFSGNQYVHALFERTDVGGGDAGIMIRRALNRASSAGSWEGNLISLATTSDGVQDRRPDISAGGVLGKVVASWTGIGASAEQVIRFSTDDGATWPVENILALDGLGYGSLAYANGVFGLAARDDNGFTLSRSDPNNLLNPWTTYNLGSGYGYRPGYDLVAAGDPTRDFRFGVAASFVNWQNSGSDALVFDAQWRDDPGYPRFEDGFPLEVPYGVGTDPVLADLDGDGTLEILFVNSTATAYAYHHDATIVSGWPVSLTSTNSKSPMAVADVDLDGAPEIAVGGFGGVVQLFGPDGTPEPGWPVTLDTEEPTEVNLGVVSHLSPMDIVVANGTDLHLLRPDGTEHEGFPVSLEQPSYQLPAIGDVDDDGDTEIVVVAGNGIFVIGPTGVVEDVTHFADTFNQPVSLGDFDLDGDLEIVIPSINGKVYLMHHDGSGYPGAWPYVDPSGSSLSEVAIADILGNSRPELAFRALDWTVHLLFEDGSEASGWPHTTTEGAAIWGAPIMDKVDTGSPDVIIGSTDGFAYAWNNLFTGVEGWPKDLEGTCYSTAASGDIDDDGNLEVVFGTSHSLSVVDVGTVPTSDPRRRWRMFGHDPQRTGCFDCTEGPATDVRTEGGIASQVRFVIRSSNPTSSAMTFEVLLPGEASVRLSLYDLDGRKIRTLAEGTLATGLHSVSWDGRNASGREVAAGSYFARLEVVGLGFESTRTRKLTWIR